MALLLGSYMAHDAFDGARPARPMFPAVIIPVILILMRYFCYI